MNENDHFQKKIHQGIYNRVVELKSRTNTKIKFFLFGKKSRISVPNFFFLILISSPKKSINDINTKSTKLGKTGQYRIAEIGQPNKKSIKSNFIQSINQIKLKRNQSIDRSIEQKN